jgi:hypothetical protein
VAAFAITANCCSPHTGGQRWRVLAGEDQERLALQEPGEWAADRIVQDLVNAALWP